MTGQVAVEVNAIGKRYRLGEYHGSRSLRETLTGRARRLVTASPRPPQDEIWSLRDVSFTVNEGDALGVIGRNGAGKSTLLRILSRITEPTTGVARMRGRVASLLEVGTGFHPELTGRENVFLNGAVLGMPRREIIRRFDEIVSFAGVERFIDTPIKRYSSGMQLRLAFAVAAHLEPDILVVDEILAVGDAEFRHKCLRRMAEVEREGRTVIFVSHDLEALHRLCPHAIWLEAGHVAARGTTDEAIQAYLASTDVKGTAISLEDKDGPVALSNVTVDAGENTPGGVLRRDRPFTVSVDLLVRDRVTRLDLAVYVTTETGIRVFDEAWSDREPPLPEGPGRYRVRLRVPSLLNVGDYRVGVWVGNAYETLLHEPMTASFRLEGSVKGRPERLVELLLPWELEVLDEPALPRRPSASGGSK